MLFNWKPSRVFYGWWIVFATFVIALYVGGVVYYGFTALFEPIANEFGWSYVQVSVAVSLRGLELGVLAPVTGLLVDRWGPRRLIVVGVALTGIGLMLLSQVNSLAMFYLVFALIAFGTSCFSITILVTAVANWFRRRVSLAIGITSTGFGFSGLLIPLVVRIIDTYEWRAAMVIFGVGLCLVGIPLAFAVRHKPEHYGLFPDGDVYSQGMQDEGNNTIKTIEIESGVKDALRSRAFWHISVASMFQSIILHATVTHVMPYLSSINITRLIGGWVASGIPLISIAGRLGFGWLGDRMSKKRLIVIGFVMVSLGIFTFANVTVNTLWLLVVFLLLFGIGYGGNNILRMALIRDYFGRRWFGSIHGMTMGVLTIGHMSGPVLAGWVYDTWGSYRGIWIAFSILALIAIAIYATLPSMKAQNQALEA